MNPARKPTTFQSARYRLILPALFRKTDWVRYSLPSCLRSCTPTSNPLAVRQSRSSFGVEYSPSGTKLKADRKPRLLSNSINWRQRSNPSFRSTSWVNTTANFFPAGHPDHPSGACPALGLMGQEFANFRLLLCACHRLKAIRSVRGTKGLTK